MQLYDDLMPAMLADQVSNTMVLEVAANIIDHPASAGPDTAWKKNKWQVFLGALTCEGRINVPVVDSFRGNVISQFHDNPESDHFGALKTTELASRDFYWAAMDSHIGRYDSGCKLCN